MQKIPHLVYGPDGNRRYAVENKISFQEAYQLAAEKTISLVDWCFEDNLVGELSLWVLQEHNFHRLPEHIEPLIKTIVEYIKDIGDSEVVEKYDLQVNLVGEMDHFVNNHGDALSDFMGRFSGKNGKTVNVLIAYNGSNELNRAWKKCLSEDIEPNFVNLSKNWSIPPVTLFYRTAQPNGFNRLTDYFPGVETARLSSTPTYPQDLTKKEFTGMIESYMTLKDSYDRL